MRFLIAIALLVTIAASSKVARPHVTGYAETKHAFQELANALDSLAYVFTAKGVKTLPLCGLSVPTLGAWAASPKLNLYSSPKPAPTAAPTAAAPAYKAPAAAAGGAAPAAYKTAPDAKYAVVKYPNKKALDDALLEASAEIVADDAAVRAKIDEIQYLQIKDKAAKDAGNTKEAAAVETKLHDVRAEAAKLEEADRVAKDADAKLKTEEVGATEFVERTTQGEVAAKAPVTDAPTEAPPKTCNTAAGSALCDEQGNTIYLGPGEEDGKVHCTGECATFWPFVRAGSIKGANIGSTGNHATYKGRPLYRFSLDNKPGQTNGHNSNGFKICKP